MVPTPAGKDAFFCSFEPTHDIDVIPVKRFHANLFYEYKKIGQKVDRFSIYHYISLLNLISQFYPKNK